LAERTKQKQPVIGWVVGVIVVGRRGNKGEGKKVVVDLILLGFLGYSSY